MVMKDYELFLYTKDKFSRTLNSPRPPEMNRKPFKINFCGKECNNYLWNAVEFVSACFFSGNFGKSVSRFLYLAKSFFIFFFIQYFGLYW